MKHFVVCLGLCFVCATAVAAERGVPAVDPLVTAENLVEAASLARDAGERFRLADEAAALCEKAAQAKPDDPEPLLLLVRALGVADPDHPERCRPGRCEKALGTLERLRKLDKLGLDGPQLASEEGILYSRMLRFDEAMKAYERALPLVEAARRPNSLDERINRVLLWGNSAETAMALGRLDDAIRRYELAIDHASYGDPEWVLAQYGLAVALDRDGQVDRGWQAMLRALEHDPSLGRLHGDGVFFAPPGDVHYYEGLAFEVSGDRPRARHGFQQYLEAQPQARWAGRARAHLAALGNARVESQAEPAAISIAVTTASRGRSESAVRARVRAHQDELQTCYGRFGGAAESLSLQLALELSTGGFPSARPHVLSADEAPLPLVRCVELAAEGWRFDPAAGESEVVLIAIDFTAPRPRAVEPRAGHGHTRGK